MVSTTYQVLGKLAPPNDVLSFSGTWNAMKRTVTLVWEEVDNIDVSHYEIRQGTSWDTATIVEKEAKKGSTAFFIEEGVAETRTYLIKAVDTSGIYSESYASTDVAIDTAETPLQVPTGLSLSTSSDIATDGTNRVGVLATWDANAEADPEFHHYNVLLEHISSGHKEEVSTKNTSYQFEVYPATEYGVAVQAVDVSGNETAYSSQVTITSAKDETAPSDPSNLSLTGFTGFIRLKWDHGGERDLSHFDVYRNTSNDFSTASKIDTSVRDFVGTWAVAKDDPGDYGTYYYWVVAVDTSGNESSAVGPASGSKTQIQETNISDSSISTPKLQANAVIADKIDAGAVTANKIDVAQLSAISADVGTLTAGVIQSSNWSTTDGTQIDLNNDVFQIGGSDSPELEWDGATLTVNGDITSAQANGHTLISGGYINTSILTADNIRTGVLQDTDGNLKFDLDNANLTVNNSGGLQIDADGGIEVLAGRSIKMKGASGSDSELRFLTSSGIDIIFKVDYDNSDLQIRPGVSGSGSDLRFTGDGNKFYTGALLFQSTVNLWSDDSYIALGGDMDESSSTQTYIYNKTFKPATDGDISLGESGDKWSEVWASDGSINTSDEKNKENLSACDLGTNFLNKLTPSKWQWKDGTRIHFGLTAQDVEKVVDSIGLTNEDFAGFCRELLYQVEYDDDLLGRSTTFVKPAHYEKDKNKFNYKKTGEKTVYGLRSHEFLGPLVKSIQEIDKRLKALEA